MNVFVEVFFFLRESFNFFLSFILIAVPTNPTFHNMWINAIENRVGKGENDSYHHFSFCHNIFYPLENKQHYYS